MNIQMILIYDFITSTNLKYLYLKQGINPETGIAEFFFIKKLLILKLYFIHRIHYVFLSLQ